jgi:hypothetical protein
MSNLKRGNRKMREKNTTSKGDENSWEKQTEFDGNDFTEGKAVLKSICLLVPPHRFWVEPRSAPL